MRWVKALILSKVKRNLIATEMGQGHLRKARVGKKDEKFSFRHFEFELPIRYSCGNA